MTTSAIIEHCNTESARPDHEVKDEYSARIDTEIGRILPQPFCRPVSARQGGNQHQTSWVRPEDVVYLEGVEPFYHHARDELLDYAVRERGNHQRHLRDMDGLYLQELPAPQPAAEDTTDDSPSNRTVLAVTQNGHHRRLVFAAIGMPVCRANLDQCQPGRWELYGGEHLRRRLLVLTVMIGCGLIEQETAADVPLRTVRFIDHTGYVGWVLPRIEYQSTAELSTEIARRTAMLDSAFGRSADPRLDILRDPEALNLRLKRQFKSARRRQFFQRLVGRWLPLS